MSTKREVGTGVVTNGIGRKTTAHLNLTVTLADRPEPRKNPNGRQMGKPRFRKMPYAGKE